MSTFKALINGSGEKKPCRMKLKKDKEIRVINIF